VIGTSVERHNSSHESASQLRSESGGESAAEHAAEGATTHAETHTELRPLGIDIEAVPFVILAALASLALAALGWLRPRRPLGLIAIALAMLAFAALDIREISHQADEHSTGLAVLAAAIAALHLGASAIAAAMARRRTATPA
jgi:hypothetical protein